MTLRTSPSGISRTRIRLGVSTAPQGVRVRWDRNDRELQQFACAVRQHAIVAALGRTSFKTQAEARMAVFDLIEGWYNPHRRHSALDYLSPIDYERAYAAQPGSRCSDQLEKDTAPPPLAAGGGKPTTRTTRGDQPNL